MHHGLANAVMIPYGMEFNKSVSGPRMKTIADSIGLQNATADGFIAWLRELNQKIGIPANLKSLNVNATHLEKLADLAIKDPCHGSNEKPVTRQDFFNLYQEAVK